jgi:poly(hydroxyalkanoate) depolymerase family esterase
VSLWSRVRALLARLFRRAPPKPGQFVADSKIAWTGFLAGAPWIAPQRDYLVYVPSGIAGRWTWRRHPLLVLLHGCRQTAEHIVTGTRIAALADRERLLVLVPRQNPKANPWGCWNWFDSATAQGRGETAIVAAQIRAVRKRYRIDRRRVYVAGMSSGAALAAVLGVRRPELIAGVFAHSGIACGAAQSGYTAMRVLAKGADADFLAIARAQREAADARTLPVPITVVQGADDDVVAPINAWQLLRQYLVLNGHRAGGEGTPSELPPADRIDTTRQDDGRGVTTREWRKGEHLVARYVEIAGLGHAWSGGDETHPYNDARAPDATALLAAFITEERAVR